MPPIASGYGGIDQSDLTLAWGDSRIVICPERVIPQRPHFAEVDLGVFKLSFVMPPMILRNTKHMAKETEGVVEVRVLKAQMDAQNGEPCGDGDRGGT